MILLRKYFSKKSAEDELESNLVKVGIGAAGFGAANSALGQELKKDTSSEGIKREGKILTEKLKKIAEKQGTTVIEKESPEIIRDLYLKENPNATKEEINRVVNRYLKLPSPYYSPNKVNEHINISKMPGRADVFAHELGHSQHHHGRDGSKLGKLAHKLDNTTRNPKVSTTALAGSGLVSGIRAGMKKEKDEKVSTLNKLTPALTGAAVFLPTVGAEIAASRRGYKLLKKSGASNEYLKHHTKNMKAALGTYLTSAGYKTVVTGYGSREFGKLIGRGIAADQKRKEKRKNKDK